jgi:hypothetical protein
VVKIVDFGLVKVLADGAEELSEHGRSLPQYGPSSVAAAVRALSNEASSRLTAPTILRRAPTIPGRGRTT